MNLKHKLLVKKAKKAINEVFKDTSVESGETMMSLKEIREELDTLLDSVSTDLKIKDDE